jgi:Family of unknown function (DUF6527)
VLRGKLRTLEGNRLAFWCPGCQQPHQVAVGRWLFNENYDAPSFSPSVLVTGKRPLTDEQYRRVLAGETFHLEDMTCHSFVRVGRLEFLADCTHSLGGQTVDLPDFPAEQDT